MANTIDSSLYLANYEKKTRQTGTDVLGKDDFLKILMVQLQNQDPSNPLEDKDFIAQMAQFSTLEQMTNMAHSFETFAQQQNESNLINYQHMMGKDVKWHKIVEDEDGNEKVEQGEGIVQSLLYKDGTVEFTLMDGTVLSPANISEVHELSNENYMVQASQLINKKLTWIDENGENQEAAVSSVIFKGGKATFVMNDHLQSSITMGQVIKISQ